MAINPVQTFADRQQFPDILGQFLRGQQASEQSARQNRLLSLQEQQFERQGDVAEEERQRRMELAETNFIGRASQVLARTSPEQQQQAYDQIIATGAANGVDVSDFPEQFSQDVLDTMSRGAQVRGFAFPADDKPVALGTKQRLVNPRTGEEIVGVSGGGQAGDAPSALLSGLPEDVKTKAREAFRLAGGGKDGVKALERTVEVGRTQTLRSEVPQILDASFPNASPSERAQIDAAVQAGKTVDAGLKQAEKIRTEQRRLKKAKGFQERAVSLLDKIISSDQIADVTGSIEGAIDFRTSDAEAELIADIEEAQNILTAENMSLMTGVLSESDIKLLKNLSSGGLNRKRSETRFIKDATQLRDKLASQLVETVDDQSGTDISTMTDEDLLNF